MIEPERRAHRRPPRRTVARVHDQHDRSTAVARFNATIAVAVTRGVGTMNCAWVFAAIALISLPAAIASGDPVIVVQWLSSVFIQLVLLSIILVGQRVQGAAADQRALDTFTDAEAILGRAEAILARLSAQDAALIRIEFPSPPAADTAKKTLPLP